jgi:hypothetical protein
VRHLLRRMLVRVRLIGIPGVSLVIAALRVPVLGWEPDAVASYMLDIYSQSEGSGVNYVIGYAPVLKRD